jgi:acyl-CoA synthetase (AMP-forming)/AMP-acid ligase II
MKRIKLGNFIQGLLYFDPWWSRDTLGTQWGEAIKAVVVLKEGKLLGANSLIDFVASRIARYKKPKFVDFIDSLPKTEGGEIDREQVKKDFRAKY